jgi:hypothetical protein
MSFICQPVVLSVHKWVCLRWLRICVEVVFKPTWLCVYIYTMKFVSNIVTDLINSLPGNGSVHAHSNRTWGLYSPFLGNGWDSVMQHGDVINNTDCFPWGLCRVLMREVNSEARSSSEYKDENGACPWIVKICWVQIRNTKWVKTWRLHRTINFIHISVKHN